MLKMKNMSNLTRAFGPFLLALCTAGILFGCQTTGSSPGTTTKATGAAPVAPPPSLGTETVFQVGELVKIDFSGTTVTELRPHEEHIKEDGTISLEYIGSIKAAGKTAGQLQTEIYTNYVPKYYRNLNVTVRGADRFYYVGGEVKLPARQPYLGPITVTGAIKSAGDFTDFANHKNVRLIHANGKIEIINCIKALEDPSLDRPVYPGDNIFVKKRLF